MTRRKPNGKQVWSALACTHGSARRHYECVSPPVKRVSAAFHMSGDGVGYLYFSRTISHRMDTVAAAGSSPPPRTSSTAQRVVTARMDGPLDLRAK